MKRHGLWTADNELQTKDYGLWTPDYEPRTTNHGLQTTDARCRCERCKKWQAKIIGLHDKFNDGESF